MIVLLQIIGWLLCAILAALVAGLIYSKQLRNDNGSLPFGVKFIVFWGFVAVPAFALAISVVGYQIARDLERAAFQASLYDLRSSAQGY